MTTPEPAKESGADGTRRAETTAEAGDLETLRKSLEEERARAESNLAGWQRAQADFSNYRRRVEQERADLTRFAAAPTLTPVLATVDDLERALAVVPPNLAQLTWVDGIFLIYRKLLAALEASGVREIEAQGQPFDPQLHEAVLHGEGPESQVVQVLQRGYYLHDRILRPALVMVGNGLSAKTASEEAASADQEEPASPSA